jgi:hypothetical protein
VRMPITVRALSTFPVCRAFVPMHLAIERVERQVDKITSCFGLGYA